MIMKRWGLFVTVVALAAGAVPGQAGVFDAWNYRMKVSFSGYNRPETLTNFPVLVVLSNNVGGAGFMYSNCVSNTGGDLRFANSNETTELNYEMEKWNTNGASYVWVQVPTLASTSDFIYAYWGCSTSTPAYTTNGATWSNDFVGVWHLDESSGNALDSTSNKYDGTITGASRGATGQVGSAYSFAGTSYIRTAVSNGPTVTISAWAQNSSATPADMLWCTKNNNTGPDLFFSGGSIYLNTWDSNGNPFGVQPVVTQMHHYVTVVDPARTELYIDGKRTFTATYKNPSGTPFFISSGAGYDWKGTIDEFSVSRVARSSNWIWACWFNQASNSAFVGYAVSDNSTPAVRNVGATNITTTGAGLMGNLDRTGSSTPSVLLFWGTADGGTNQAAWAHTNDFGPVAVTGPLTTNVTGLIPGTVYYYRYYASNTSGQAWASPAATFLAGLVQVQATISTATYGTSGTFTVSRPVTATNGALTVNYALGGSASNGLDYAWVGNSVTILDGASNAVVTVTPALDMDLTNEDVVLTLGPGAYVTGAVNQATVTITPWSGLTTLTGNWYVAANGNDTWAGTNWATAFATISNGVGHATNAQSVLVGMGTYNVTTQINVTTNLTLWGVGGASNTIVVRGNPIISNRIFSITHAGATVDGFTITNGYESTDAGGGGVLMTGGRLVNCLITGNTDTKPSDGRPYGGGVFVSVGFVSNCTIRGNVASGSYAKGGGVGLGGPNATVTHCVIDRNRANENGGGVAYAGGGRLLNSLIAYNTAGNSAGVLLDAGGSPIMVNCTVVSNTASAGGYAMYSTVATTYISNCICYHNINGDIRATDASYYGYCCATGL